MRIYTAGPLGFSEAGAAFHDGHLVPLLSSLGHEILDPWKLTSQEMLDEAMRLPYGQKRRDAWRALNVIIGQNNVSAIDSCDLVVAVLDGVDVDSGTASEIGYAFARAKKILGYRGDFRLSADNDGAVINLQVEYFIRQSGGDIVTKLDEIPPALERMTSK